MELRRGYRETCRGNAMSLKNIIEHCDMKSKQYKINPDREVSAYTLEQELDEIYATIRELATAVNQKAK